MNSIEKLAHDLRALGAVGSDYPVTFQGRFGGDTIPQAAELLEFMPEMLAAIDGLVAYAENATLEGDELPPEVGKAKWILSILPISK